MFHDGSRPAEEHPCSRHVLFIGMLPGQLATRRGPGTWPRGAQDSGSELGTAAEPVRSGTTRSVKRPLMTGTEPQPIPAQTAACTAPGEGALIRGVLMPRELQGGQRYGGPEAVGAWSSCTAGGCAAGRALEGEPWLRAPHGSSHTAHPAQLIPQGLSRTVHCTQLISHGSSRTAHPARLVPHTRCRPQRWQGEW